MGRSTSCFKIITCAGGSQDTEEHAVLESNSLGDKHGWSFRKRSARQRVLSNTVIAENLPGNKESTESAAVNFQAPDELSVQEESSATKSTDDKLQISSTVDAKVSETVLQKENDINNDFDLKESAVIVIQTVVRGLLARKELVKQKNAIKLQAAIRGHVVRRHAVGTLRCVQAIIKLQLLVRARHAQRGQEKKNTMGGKLEEEECNLKSLEKNNFSTKSAVTYTSLEKLLNNKFACQLLESSHKTKSINIKCDPSKPNSAWKWLERWMSVSSVDQSLDAELMTQCQEEEEEELVASQPEAKVLSEVSCEHKDSKSSATQPIMTAQNEENLMTYDWQCSNLDINSAIDSSVEPNIENRVASHTKDVSEVIDSVSDHILGSGADSQTEITSRSNELEIENSEQPKKSMKRNATEELETDGKKYVYGSRKASNPAFIAAQSKFEELSSSARSGKLNISSSGTVSVEPKLDTSLPRPDTVSFIQSKEQSMTDKSVSHSSTVQAAGSECSTELSISSTLDSPDISEVGSGHHECENKIMEGVQSTSVAENLEVENQMTSTAPVSHLSHSDTNQLQLEKINYVNVESKNSIVAENSNEPEQKAEGNALDLQREFNVDTGRQSYRSSPEASPRSHATVPESQGTPSSQVSVKPKRDSGERKKFSHKRKSLSGGKKSPSIPNPDSHVKGSIEQLSKDQKTGKRRNSFGSTKSDHIDPEPGDSNSSSSLPRFMQATESARAKAHSNNSPRSSPDVHEREIYIKKRHSLPGAGGRQGSPRIQQSTSQAQQTTKGSSIEPSQERKWQR